MINQDQTKQGEHMKAKATITPYRPYIVPTRHEKLEWARMANDLYSVGINWLGHRMSTKAALPEGAEIEIFAFDQLMRDYRSWLIEGTIGFNA